MWYVSGLRWERSGDSLRSFYHIKYAESEDGVLWRRDGRVAIPLAPGESNIARTCVLKEEHGYRAWYSFSSGDGYRIGTAISRDGVSWERRDAEAGIGLSNSGWDSLAIAYPWVFRYGGREFMLYNGNGFGGGGFGLAFRTL